MQDSSPFFKETYDLEYARVWNHRCPNPVLHVSKVMFYHINYGPIILSAKTIPHRD
jgi:hypothetical protein